jgi:hypothetical protein
LKQFADAGKVMVRKYGNRLIYSAPTHWKGRPYQPDDAMPKEYQKELEERFYQIEHGRAVTKEIIRFWRSSMRDSQMINKRDFKGSGVVADWAFRFISSEHLLIGEHITKNYFYRTSALKLKIRKYSQSFETLKERFKAQAISVLLVVDVPEKTLTLFIGRLKNIDAEFFFTTYDALLSVEIGKQFSSPIYIWGRDGKRYPLGKDE